jgi:hypothetical protein
MGAPLPHGDRIEVKVQVAARQRLPGLANGVQPCTAGDESRTGLPLSCPRSLPCAAWGRQGAQPAPAMSRSASSCASRLVAVHPRQTARGSHPASQSLPECPRGVPRARRQTTPERRKDGHCRASCPDSGRAKQPVDAGFGGVVLGESPLGPRGIGPWSPMNKFTMFSKTSPDNRRAFPAVTAASAGSAPWATKARRRTFF